MSGLRWRLARLLVGPIIRDPIAGPDGCAVVVRSEGVSATWTPQKFRIRSRAKWPPLLDVTGVTSLDYAPRSQNVVTFAGTLVR